MPRIKAIQAAAVARGMRVAMHGAVDPTLLDAEAVHAGQVPALLEDAMHEWQLRQASEKARQSRGE